MNAFLTLLWIGVAVLALVAYWRIFDKAGQPGWASLIPIYNLVKLLQITDRSGVLCPVPECLRLYTTRVRLVEGVWARCGFRFWTALAVADFPSGAGFRQFGLRRSSRRSAGVARVQAGAELGARSQPSPRLVWFRRSKRLVVSG